MGIADVRIVGLRHVLFPKRLNNGVHSDPTGITRARSAGGWLVRDSVHSYWIRIEIVRNPGASLVDLNYTRAKRVSGNLLVDDLALREIKAFVAEEEISFTTQKTGQHGTAHCPSIAVVVGNWYGRVSQISARGVIVVPGVCSANVGRVIVPIRRAMKIIGATLGYHLHLSAT